MSRENAKRPTVEGAGQENFIPWSQIEPLVRPGMTGEQIGTAIIERTGLQRGKYKLVSGVVRPGATLMEALRGGMYLVRRDTEEFQDRSDEVVA